MKEGVSARLSVFIANVVDFRRLCRVTLGSGNAIHGDLCNDIDARNFRARWLDDNATRNELSMRAVSRVAIIPSESNGGVDFLVHFYRLSLSFDSIENRNF